MNLIHPTKLEQIGLNFFERFNPKGIRDYISRVKLRRIKEDMKVII